MTYDEALDYAIRLKESDLWVYYVPEEKAHEVIRGFAYAHYCRLGWVPKAHIVLKPEITEMFTGVVVES